jgi:hypothetical protein
MTARASNLRLEPAQNILSLSLADADVQAVAEGLHVFYVCIVMCYAAKDVERRAAQFEDPSVEAGAQPGWGVFGDESPIFHKADAMTA